MNNLILKIIIGILSSLFIIMFWKKNGFLKNKLRIFFAINCVIFINFKIFGIELILKLLNFIIPDLIIDGYLALLLIIASVEEFKGYLFKIIFILSLYFAASPFIRLHITGKAYLSSKDLTSYSYLKQKD
jgi:hypothetical protein